MARLLLQLPERLFQHRLVDRPELGMFRVKENVGKQRVADGKGLKTGLVRAAPDNKRGRLLDLETDRMLGILAGPEETDDVEAESAGPNRLLESLHDQHELVQKRHLVQPFSLDPPGCVVGDQ